METKESKLEKRTAFAAYLLDAYLCAGRAIGLSEQESGAITDNVFRNALRMGRYGDTAEQVATKGGATREGLDVMERADVRRLLRERGGAAYERAKGKKTQPY